MVDVPSVVPNSWVLVYSPSHQLHKLDGREQHSSLTPAAALPWFQNMIWCRVTQHVVHFVDCIRFVFTPEIIISGLHEHRCTSNVCSIDVLYFSLILNHSVICKFEAQWNRKSENRWKLLYYSAHRLMFTWCGTIIMCRRIQVRIQVQ